MPSPSQPEDDALRPRNSEAERDRLIEANVGLCGYIAGRQLERHGGNFEEYFSECQMALVRAATTFDAGRGFRFSTYACRAMIRATYRLNMERLRPLELDRIPNSDWLPTANAAVEMGATDKDIRAAMKRLPLRERQFIRWRFGMTRGHIGHRETLEELGVRFGYSKERARQVQNAILAKLKAFLQESL